MEQCRPALQLVGIGKQRVELVGGGKVGGAVSPCAAARGHW